MKIDVSSLINLNNKRFYDLSRESVTVGILDNAPAAIPNYNLSRRLPNDSSGLRVLRVKKKSPLMLKQLAKILDSNPLFRIFSDPKITGANRFARQVAEQFAKLDKTPSDILMLERACRAMIRNPIYQAQYMAQNDPAYAKKKLGNAYGIATGTFFGSIKARYSRR